MNLKTVQFSLLENNRHHAYITGLARPATLKLTPLHYQSKTAVRREADARTVVYKKKRLTTPPPHHPATIL